MPLAVARFNMELSGFPPCCIAYTVARKRLAPRSRPGKCPVCAAVSVEAGG